MSKQRKALQAALERLEHLEFNKPHVRGTDDCHEDIIEEIRAALDEQDAEPVAWLDDFGNAFPLDANKGAGSWRDSHKRNWQPLYTAPPRREWQSLTEEEIFALRDAHAAHLSWGVRDFASAIEAALKEKNND